MQAQLVPEVLDSLVLLHLIHLVERFPLPWLRLPVLALELGKDLVKLAAFVENLFLGLPLFLSLERLLVIEVLELLLNSSLFQRWSPFYQRAPFHFFVVRNNFSFCRSPLSRPIWA